MKSAKKSYRLLSALSLMLFLSSIALPVSISAASLLCEMDMSKMNHQTHACCDWHGDDTHDESTVSLNKVPCNYQEICGEVVSKDQKSIEAIPQLSKSVAVAFIFTSIFPADAAAVRNHPPHFEAPAPKADQPIFLLNSAFLN